MLELNETFDKLEGELKLSDCETEYVVKWLSGRSQASFYIGDEETDHENVRGFINGYRYCYINIPSYLTYLRTIEHIVKKYKSMYYGPFDHIPAIYNRFSMMSQEDAKIVLNYEYPDRYIRILNNRKGYKDNVLVYGDEVLKNGDDFRHSYIGGITKIIIQKENDTYTLYISLIENWREVLMRENGAKVTLESLVVIFNDEMKLNLKEGKSQTISAQIFGVKYGPLLRANEYKFTYEEIVANSQYSSDDIKDAVKNGMELSPSIIWSPDLMANEDGVDTGIETENYTKFKNLCGWFVKQLNINNGLESGIKTSGQGYKEGAAIREQYKEWRDYGEFTLDCNIIAGYQSTFSKVNYINKTETGINVRPKFNKETKEIEYLFIDVYESKKDLNEEISKILEKEYDLTALSLFDGLEPNALLIELFEDYKKVIKYFVEEEQPKFDDSNRLTGGTNIILYGVPGAGKSWTVKNEYCDENTKMERVVFHPDYTYSDFVGQILPQSINGDVTYEFIPGPFSKIIKESYWNPTTKFILVIEEINRGNAPAIFGDIFQLLDRDVNGSSEYKVNNSDIAKVVFGKEDAQIFIPSNLSIICTMNTSDQNVFTLDTAFQRRWNMRLIENTFKKESVEDKKFAEHTVLDTSISWEDFCGVINDLILDKNQNMTSSEDKRLGTHFVTIEDLTYYDSDSTTDEKEKKEYALKNRRFPEKVIKYLWDDAFKFYRDEIFKGEYNSLEKVIRTFITNKKDERFVIFNDNIKGELNKYSKKSKEEGSNE